MFFGFFKKNPKKMEEKGDIKGLIKAMGDTDDKIRVPAIHALCRIAKSEHSKLLVEYLNDGLWRIRAGALEVLSCIHDVDATSILKALRDKHAEVRRSAAETLEKLGYKPKDEEETINLLLARDELDAVLPLGEASIGPLLKALEWGDASIRGSAVRAIGGIGGSESFEALARALSSEEDDGVRHVTVLALKETGMEALQPLISVLGDPSFEVRNSAAEILAAMGEYAVQPLIDALQNKREFARSRASYALGVIKDRRAVDPLIQVLGDDAETVRWNASKALGEIGDPTALNSLSEMLNDESCSVQYQATLAMINYGEKGASILLDALNGDGDVSKQNIIAALGELKAEEAVPAILRELDNDDYEVSWNSVVALGKIGDKRAVKPLQQKMRERDKKQKGNIIIALRDIGGSTAAEALQDALSDREPVVRGLALAALAQIGDKSSTPSIINALGDRDPRVRTEAVRVLGVLGDPSALPLLVDLHTRVSLSERQNIEQAIDELRKR